MKRTILISLLLFSVWQLSNRTVDLVLKIEEKDSLDEIATALIVVESNGKHDAHNKGTNAAGVLQIRPIYVMDVNRILGKRLYTLEDRFDSIKSVEMFKIIQNFYNPEGNIKKAIQMHHGGLKRYKEEPNHNIWYFNKVMNIINTNNNEYSRKN